MAGVGDGAELEVGGGQPVKGLASTGQVRPLRFERGEMDAEQVKPTDVYYISIRYYFIV